MNGMRARSILKGSALVALLVAIVAIALLLSSCGESAPKKPKVLRILTWDDYITDNMNAGFSNEFGVELEVDTFATNEELLEELKTNKESYDVIFPSDYMAGELIGMKAVAPLDPAKLANLGNIGPRFRNLPYDPEGKYCVPYSWGMTALAVNTKLVTKPVTSWAALWDPDFTGHVSVLDEARSGFVPAFKRLGLSINPKSEEEIDRATELVRALRPLLKAYTSDRYEEFLRSKQVWIAQGFSGDILKLSREIPAIQYVLPEEGSEVWVDTVCIPKDSKNRELAHRFIDYLLRPDVAAHFTNRTHFATPNEGALAAIDAKIRNNPSVFPPDEILQKSEFMRDIGELKGKLEAAWNEAKMPGK